MTLPVRLAAPFAAPPLEGELIDAAAGTVTVLVAAHPLSAATQRLALPAGETVAELAQRVLDGRRSRLPGHVKALVGGELVPAGWWGRVRPRPGTVVVFRAVATGEVDSALRNVLGLAVALLALVVAPYLAPLVSMSVGLVGAGLTLAGTLLVNALFPLRPTQIDKANSVYSLSANANTADLYGPVPVVLGRTRVYPRFGASAYTEFVGDDQYLRMLVVWGYGPLSISEIRIGDTLLSDYDDVEIETREGWPDDAPVTLYPAQVLQEDLSIDLTYEAGWQTRTTAEAITEISLDYVAPSGLFKTSSSGERKSWTVDLEVQYCATGSGAWATFETATLTAQSPDPIRRTLRKVVDEGQYDIRIRKTSEDNEKATETLYWTALRGLRTDPPLDFEVPLAVSAIRIRATSQLNGAISNLNGICASVLPAFDGADWIDDQESRNPADLFVGALRHPANARPVSDSRIDFATIEAWHAECAAQGWTFDQQRGSVSSVFDLLADIAAAGRASPTLKDGKWSVVWDDPEAEIVDHYTPQTSKNFRGKRVYRTLPHAFRVRFVNAAKGYAEDERLVFADGYDAETATLFESIEFPGVTDSDLIWRHGRFQHAQATLRPEEYTLEVDAASILVTRGDRVRVTYDVPLWGLGAGRVKAVEDLGGGSYRVTLNQTVLMEAATDYAIRFTAPDGSSAVCAVVTDDGLQSEVTVTGASAAPAEGDRFGFGTVDRDSVVLRVKSLRRMDDFRAELTLVDDAPEIRDADTGTIPAYDSGISVPPDPYTLAPINLSVTERLTLVGGVATVSAVVAWETVVAGQAASFDVDYRDDASTLGWRRAGSVTAPVKVLEIFDLAGGGCSFRVRTLFADGSWSRWATLSGQTLIGLNRQPDDVTDFRIAVLDDVATLSWSAVSTPGLSHYVVRFSTDLVTASWDTATILLSQVDGISAQAPTMIGSYLIKAVTVAGVESATAAKIVSAVAGLRGLNVVETLSGPAWTGTADDVDEDSDLLRLAYDDGYAAEGTFTFADIVDLGEVYTSRVSGSITAAGESVSDVMAGWVTLASVVSLTGSVFGSWSARIEERHTSDDPDDPGATWTDWAELQVGDFSARAYGWRLHLSTTDPSITPVVSAASMTVDMPDRIEAGNDLAVGTGGLAVSFDPPFRELDGVAISAQGLATGDYYSLTAKSETGFTIRFFDAAGAGVARSFDFVAKGYGRRLDA